MSINKTQLNAILRGLPLYAAPTVTQIPYVATETRVGDTVFSAPSVVTPGYPGPLTVASSLVVDGVTQALGYVVQASDVGKTLTRSDVPSNVTGSAPTSTSNPVTIQALQTFNDVGLFGGNVDNALDSNTNRLLLNAAAEGRTDGGGGIPGSNGYAPYTLGRLGNDISADPVSNPNGVLTLSTLTAGTDVSVSMGAGVGTTALAGDATDVGRIIYLPTGNATITAFGTTTTCTVTLNNTQSSTTISSGQWSIAQPPLIFGATSGTTSMRITTTAVSIALTGDSKDVNKRFNLGNGISALVTTFGTTTTCTVAIQGGTLPSTTVAGKAWSVSPDLDSNGWPRCPTTNIYASSYGYAGQYSEGLLAPSAGLPDGVYHYTVKSATAGMVVTFTGSNGSITTPVTAGPDGQGLYTTTFDLTVGASRQSTSTGIGTTIALNFSQGYVFADCPRDGSYSSVGKPEFYQPALAYYSQFTYLRFMDFLGTNGNTSGLWSERPKDYVQARGHYSWEFLISFINAIAAYPGSKLKKAHVCTPPFASLSYVSSLRDFINTSSLTSSVLLIVERGNEEWNTQFKMYFNDRTTAYNEVGAVSSGYGSGASAQIVSMVGDGTNVTVTLDSPLPSFVTGATNLIAATITPNLTAWSKGSYSTPVTVTGTNPGAKSFTYASTNTGTLRLSTYTGDSTLTFASTVAGAGVAVSCVNATFTAGDVGMCVRAGGVLCPITAVTDSTHATVTIPTGGVSSTTFAAGAWTITTSLNGVVQIALYLNPSSTLLAGGNLNLYQTVLWHHARQQYLAWQNWTTVRPQDKFLISSQIGNTTATFNASVFYGGGTATWAYGMVIAPYNTPTASTLDGVFTSMNANFPGLVAQMKAHIATCRAAGIRPMCYEGGVQMFDAQVPDHAVQYNAHKDPRMLTQMQNLWTAFMQMGGLDWAQYQLSPQSFYFFGTIENFSDTTSPKLVGIQNGANTSVSYVDINAADNTNLYSSSTGGQYNATSGVLYSYSLVARTYVHNITINRGRRYKFVVEGTTNTTNDNVTIAVDGVTLGTLTLAKNGSASGGAAASVSIAPKASFVAEMTSGYHTLSISFAAGSASGYKRVTFIPV